MGGVGHTIDSKASGKRSVDATGSAQVKVTKGDKKLHFTPYSDAEKRFYQRQIHSLGCTDPAEDPGARPVTAIDDFSPSDELCAAACL